MIDMRSLIRVVTSAEAAARDRAAIQTGTPSRALMQRAGAATASEIAIRLRSRLRAGALVFAGPGNNGGDAWVVARALAATGVRVRVCEPVPAQTDDALAERALALPFVEPAGAADTTALGSGDIYHGEGIVLDGLLGTGASGAPRGEIGSAVRGMRAIRERGGGAPAFVALDLPTGVDATTGVMHSPVRAELTFTYGTLKRGHLIARATCGRIAVLDIGLGAHAALDDTAPAAVNSRWVGERVPEFSADAHKGTRKKLAIVGGGPGMSGAAIQIGRASCRERVQTSGVDEALE